MNEKIRELAEQALKATKNNFAYDWDGTPRKEFENFYNKKFAELIVKECAHLVGGYTKENEFGTDVKEAYEEITKHFGVGE